MNKRSSKTLFVSIGLPLPCCGGYAFSSNLYWQSHIELLDLLILLFRKLNSDVNVGHYWILRAISTASELQIHRSRDAHICKYPKFSGGQVLSEKFTSMLKSCTRGDVKISRDNMVVIENYEITLYRRNGDDTKIKNILK